MGLRASKWGAVQRRDYALAMDGISKQNGVRPPFYSAYPM
jgi:hypothetical protein